MFMFFLINEYVHKWPTMANKNANLTPLVQLLSMFNKNDEYVQVRDPETHARLQSDLVEEMWNRHRRRS